MKKIKISKEIRTILLAYFLFFLVAGFILSSSFLLFFNTATNDVNFTREQIEVAAKNTFVNTLVITFLFTVSDIIRRKITVDRPVRQIKDALERITKGDFDIRLSTRAFNRNYSQIMKSINTMTEELSGVETLRKDFISNVSHEMKTPLAVIGNYGTLLQNPDITDEERVEYAKIIADTSKHLGELVTNILKLNRLENQQIYPDVSEFDLGEQLCEVLLQFENIWEDKNIEISTEIPEDVVIRADSELLSLVWSNLFSNAFKFTKNGGKVSLKLSEDDRFATISVTDSGCGMSAETGKHIFEKFYQGDTSHATKGNGLGLALVKRIIDITGGEISVESTLGRGSTFTVRVPK